MGSMERTRTTAKGLAALRIALGAGFLYAGLDKVFHFDGSTDAFSAGGFLKFATAGTLPGSAEKAIVNPTHDFWVGLAGNPGLVSVINVLVVAGEIGIGIALILGIATRFAGTMGALMMGLFWVASFDFAHGLVNEQFLYGVVAAFLAYAAAGEAYGIDALIEKARVVTQHPRLRLVLG
jgi:thiosulfate dehydrogenase (quinone) large subunit